MKPKSKSLLTPKRTISMLATLPAAVLVAAVTMAALTHLAERRAHAFPTGCTGSCGIIPLGMVGIVPGQTARLNVFTQATSEMSVAAPTMVTLSFIQSNGDQLIDPISGQPAQMSTMLATNQAASLDLAYPPSTPSGPFATGSRVELRALVEVSSVAGGLATSDAVASLELFDTATGKTSVVLTPINPGLPAV